MRGGTVSAENPVWERFARAMVPMMAIPAEKIAPTVELPTDRPVRVLDIAAGHGLFGIAVAKRYPNAEIVALDWPAVLEVARENADRAGVGDRVSLSPGSAFDVDFGTGYDLVRLTKFLHHFDAETCEALLRKIRASLGDGDQVATFEFVPNDDRVSPPVAAAFSFTMLNTTPSGDAYTFAELERMLANAGFSSSQCHEVIPGANAVIVSRV